MIWGLTLEPGKVYTEVIQDEVQLSMATLESRKEGCDGEKEGNFSHIVMATNNAQYLLCTLVNGATYQQTLDLRIMPQEKVTFSVEGPNTVYLMGYSTVYPEVLQELQSDEEKLSGWDEDPTAHDVSESDGHGGVKYTSNEERPGDDMEDSELEVVAVPGVSGDGEGPPQGEDGEVVTDKDWSEESGNRSPGASGTEQKHSQGEAFSGPGVNVKCEPLSPQPRLTTSNPAVSSTAPAYLQPQQTEQVTINSSPRWPVGFPSNSAFPQTTVGQSSHDRTGFIPDITPGQMSGQVEQSDPIVIATPHLQDSRPNLQDSSPHLQDSSPQPMADNSWSYGGHGLAANTQGTPANWPNQVAGMDTLSSMQFQPLPNVGEQTGANIVYGSSMLANIPRNTNRGRGRGYQNIRGLSTSKRTLTRGKTPTSRGALGRGNNSRGSSQVRGRGRSTISSTGLSPTVKIEPGLGYQGGTIPGTSSDMTAEMMTSGQPGSSGPSHGGSDLSGQDPDKVEQSSASAPDPKMHQCRYCPKRFLRSGHWKRHEDTHSGTRPHVCPICKTNFSRNDNLVRHMKSSHRDTYMFFKGGTSKKAE